LFVVVLEPVVKLNIFPLFQMFSLGQPKTSVLCFTTTVFLHA
jgi:hypothetical protein